MAYQALYRKYRPTNFDEVVGQTHVVQTLKNAVVQDRIAHAYLFCGPRGTGKTSIAKIFARMLNCTSENNDRPCGECPNCKMALNGSHPDIIEIDAASNNGVDEVRNLIDKVKYAPMEGSYKVYIIDEVHMMTTGAFNALLKTIEEPPKHVIFVLATTEPNKVLPTIISRCQRFDFTRVSNQDIVRRLRTVCNKEGIEINDEALSLIATLSDGGMRDSLSILDQCVAYCNATIETDDIRQIYGVITLSDIGQLYDKLVHKDIDGLMQQLQTISDQGMDLKRLTSDFIRLLKDSIILDYANDSTLVYNESREVIHKYMLSTSLPFRIQLMDVLMDTYNKYRFASNVLDYLEGGLLKVISSSYEQKEEISKKSDVEKSEFIKKEENEVKSYSHESSSEKEEKAQEITVLSTKEPSQEQETPSDVSRETLKQSETVNHKIIFENEFILQLLVGANKEYRKSDEEKYENKILYLSDPMFGKFAASIQRANIMACGETYIVVDVNSELEAKNINELQQVEGYESFTNALLEKPKKIFAVSSEQKANVLNEFVQRSRSNSLPQAANIVIDIPAEEIEESANEESELLELFPDMEIVED